MKKILTILFISFSFAAQSQVLQTPQIFGTLYRNLGAKEGLVVPTFCGTPTLPPSVKNYRQSAIAYDSCNHIFYVFSPTDSTWKTISGSGIDSLAHRTWVQATDSSYLGVKNLKNNVDTLVVIAPNGAIAGGGGGNTDTTSLSNRINNKWDLNGNAGTNPANNFIGTTDNQPLIFKTNNILAGYVSQISYNVSLGDNSLPYSTTAFADNSNIGHNGLRFNTTGAANSNLGAYGLLHNTTGSLNNNLGTSGLFNNTTGSFNNSLGNTSLYNNNGNYNTALGDSSLYNNTTGNYNIGLGHKSGINQTTASNTLYISDSTYHGYWELDSASGTAPSVIGKDANGYWHTYQTPIRPYKVYTALLSQTGTSAPTATVLENTLGVTVTFSYVSTGRYTANISTTLFAPNKTFVVIQNTPYTNINYAEAAVASASNYIDIWVRTPSTGSLVNGLYNASFEIRVYN